MADQNKNMIRVIHKDGETVTHFNRQSFLKNRPDKEGYRAGWKPYDGEVPIPDALTGESRTNANVPEVLKTFKPDKKVEGVSEDEVQRRIQLAVEKDRASRNRAEMKNVSSETLNINTDGTANEANKVTEPVKQNTVTDMPDTTNANPAKATELKDLKDRVEGNDPSTKPKAGNTSGKTTDNTRNK